MIDSHCHFQNQEHTPELNFKRESFFLSILPQYSDFLHIHLCATHLNDFENLIALSSLTQIDISLGIHPWYCQNLPSDWLNTLSQKLLQNPTAQLGECGLDFFKSIKKPRPPIELQSLVLEKQLALACDLKRSVSLHCVRAIEPLLKLCKKYPNTYLIHSFSESAEVAKVCARMGIYMSFSHLSLKKPKEELLRILAQIPAHLLLIESDSMILAEDFLSLSPNLNTSALTNSKISSQRINTPLWAKNVFNSLQLLDPSLDILQIEKNYQHWKFQK